MSTIQLPTSRHKYKDGASHNYISSWWFQGYYSRSITISCSDIHFLHWYSVVSRVVQVEKRNLNWIFMSASVKEEGQRRNKEKFHFTNSNIYYKNLSLSHHDITYTHTRYGTPSYFPFNLFSEYFYKLHK